ncbi:MAG: TGS domain-containing protein, partial [Dehalococcoidia bacterium]
MPANLPPQYFEAEKRFRLAKSPEEKIATLEEMLAIMPKHKGTDHLRGELRARIAKLTQLAAKKSGVRRASMAIDKEGAAQIVVVGVPNCGKSQLVASITNASPAVAEYPFTTQGATPGMMVFENIQIQLIDTPPLSPQPMPWWLRHMLIRADALLIVVDLSDAPLSQMEEIMAQLVKARVGFGGREAGGEAEIILYCKKALIVGNKLDLGGACENFAALEGKYKDFLPAIPISAKEGTGLEELKGAIYQMLNIICVYTKVPGQKPDFTEPIVLARGSTVGGAAAEVHKDFAQKLKYARIWGSGKHDGLMVKRDHILEDGD